MDKDVVFHRVLANRLFLQSRKPQSIHHPKAALKVGDAQNGRSGDLATAWQLWAAIQGLDGHYKMKASPVFLIA
jgi:hypothetical protein